VWSLSLWLRVVIISEGTRLFICMSSRNGIIGGKGLLPLSTPLRRGDLPGHARVNETSSTITSWSSLEKEGAQRPAGALQKL